MALIRELVEGGDNEPALQFEYRIKPYEYARSLPHDRHLSHDRFFTSLECEEVGPG